ncbi:class I SAM-dependent methyltransferase [Paracandidimonas soli]|uniref:class I SAM-dependent methyltransferase n=1 Tax=Paracandidimonas soli TaxID=1917182 RepID=UPI003342D764
MRCTDISARSPSALMSLHALQPCWDMQLAGLGADALRMALEAGMFTHLEEFVSAPELARCLGLEPANTGYFLELLWGMEMLERRPREGGGMEYRMHVALRPYLHPASGQYCGDALLFRHQVLRRVGMQLQEELRNGVPEPKTVDPVAMQQGWARAAKIQISQEQQAVTAQVACDILGRQPEFAQARRMLDLGGGPGLVAIALAKLRQGLSGVVFEYPPVAAVAQDAIERAGLAGRLQARGGDLATADFGNGYDFIWCSSVLHFVPNIPAVLARLHAALRPGGLLVCCHAEIGGDVRQARPVLQYYLHLRMQGRHVLPRGRLASLLRDAGFARVEQIDGVCFPMAPVAVLLARKGESKDPA